MLKITYGMLLMLLFLPFVSFGQDSALVMPDWFIDGHTQYLNVDIASDTAASPSYQAGNRVYVLKKGGIYYWNRAFSVPKGRILKIASDNGASKYDPIIFLYQTGTGTGTQPIQPPGTLTTLNGGDLNLKNIMVSGYDELVDSCLNWIQGGMVNIPSGGAGASITIDHCVLKSWNGNHIRTEGYAKAVKVTNTLFADMGFLGRSNLGAGKAFDFRNVQVDTAIIQNCTFINWQDRIIRHLNSTAPIKNLIFDHNTLINGMSYHGFLNLGKVDSTGGGIVRITNNLLIDPFSLGNDTDVTRQAEFTDNGEKDPTNTKGRMVWVDANPNDAVNWDIRNNYYAISDSGQAFLDTYPFYKNEGPPLTWRINARLNALGKDTLSVFQKIVIKPVKVPKLMLNFNRWYYSPGGANKTKQTNNFTQSATPGVWTYDYDRKGMWWYADSLDCDFYSSVNLMAAGTDGMIIGDPRWNWLGYVPGIMIFSATPKSLDFGTVAKNDSKTDTIVVASGGSSSLVIDSIKSSAAEFTVTPSTASIDAGTSAKFVVTYHPTTAGAKSGTIVFYHNGLSQIDTVAVAGDVVNAATFDASVTSINFGTVNTNVTKKDSVVITNHGTIDLTITAVTSNNAVFTVTPTSATIGVEASEKFYITFAPTADGTQNGKIAFTHNALTNDTITVTGNGHLVSVGDIENAIPEVYKLHDNYPNPFNPSTTIQYDLPKQSIVTLKVYSLLGQEVATLVNNDQAAGYHKVVWMGQNNSGKQVSTGIYIVRISAKASDKSGETYTQVKKALLLK